MPITPKMACQRPSPTAPTDVPGQKPMTAQPIPNNVPPTKIAPTFIALWLNLMISRSFNAKIPNIPTTMADNMNLKIVMSLNNIAPTCLS